MRRARQVGGHVHPPVGAAALAAVRRVVGVHQPGALLEDREGRGAVGGARREGRGHQPAFDVVGGEAGVGLQQQRRHPRNHRRRLRGAGHGEVDPAVVELGVFAGNATAVGHQGHHVSAGGDHFRLDQTLGGGADRGERGQPVVGWVSRRVIVGHRAHGDDVGDVAGYADGHGGGTGIAGRGHHHDPGLPRGHHRLIQRVVPVVRLGRGAEGQVEHSDAVGGLVGHQPVEAADHVGVAPLALLVEGPHHHQVGVGRHPTVLTRLPGYGAVHSDAGDVGAMPAAVGVLPLVERGVGQRVILRQDAGFLPGVLRQGFLIEEAGVEHRQGHVRAGDALRVQPIRADQGHVAGIFERCAVIDRLGRAGYRPVLINALDTRRRPQGLPLRLGQPRRDRPDDTQLVGDLAAGGPHRRRDRRQVVTLNNVNAGRRRVRPRRDEHRAQESETGQEPQIPGDLVVIT